MRIIGLTGGDDASAGAGKDTVAGMLVDRHGFIRIGLADPLKRFLWSVFLFTSEQLWGPTEARNQEDDRYGRPWESLAWTRAARRFQQHAASWLFEMGLSMTGASMQALRLWFLELMLGAGGIDLTGEDCEVKPLSVRRAAQRLGTEFCRAQDPNLLMRYLLRQVAMLEQRGAEYLPHQGVTMVGIGRRPVGVVVSDVRYENEVDGIRAANGIVVGLEGRGAPLAGEFGAHPSENGLRGVPRDYTLRNDGTLAQTARDLDSIVLAWSGCHPIAGHVLEDRMREART